LDDAFKKIKEESITASCHPAIKLLFIAFYGGQGVLSNGMTRILFNSKIEEDQFYPLEK